LLPATPRPALALPYHDDDIAAARACLDRGLPWFRIERETHSAFCFSHREPETLDAEMTVREARGAP
jgi:hypothetical protein